VLLRPISTDDAEAISRLLMVVGQPVRIRMIDVLERGAGKLTVQQLADELGVSVTDASQHLRYLRDAQIVRGRRRGRATCYQVIDRRPLDIYKRAIECVKEPNLEPAREAA